MRLRYGNILTTIVSMDDEMNGWAGWCLVETVVS